MPDMEDKMLTGQESLQIIQKMIQTAKDEQKDNGTGWILWGWCLFAVSILSYLNMEQGWFLNKSLFWDYFGVFTLIMLVYKIVRYFFMPANKRASSYTTDIFNKLNIGFFILIIFIVFSMNRGVGVSKGFTIMIATYGFWILIYGTLMNFKPSVIAAFITWAIAFTALFMANNYQQVMLFHAAAVLCGYIIPGHIAFYEFRKINPPAMA